MIMTPVFLGNVEVDHGSLEHPNRVEEILKCGVPADLAKSFQTDRVRFPEIHNWEVGKQTVALYVACIMREMVEGIHDVNQRLIAADFIYQGFAPFCSALRIRALPDKLLALGIKKLEATCPKCFRVMGNILAVPGLSCFPEPMITFTDVNELRYEDYGYLVAKKT